MSNIKEQYNEYKKGVPKRLMKIEFAVYRDDEHVNALEVAAIMMKGLKTIDKKGYKFEGLIEETNDKKVVERLKNLRESH